MSTLEVTCGRCDKRFRVRAEFAGKSTRCPGCSAPITIGGSKPAPPPRTEPPERPRPRPRPRDDEDERPRPPAGNWQPVATALGREQVAVVFVLLTILGSFLVICLGNAAGHVDGEMQGAVIGLMLLFLVGPSLVATVFGLSARISALGAPEESLARGSATASLLCAFAALAALLMLGITFLAGLDRQGPAEMPTTIAIGGLLVSMFGAMGTFLGYVAQVGIARRSADVSRAVGRTAMGTGICVLALLGVGILLALASASMSPGYSNYGRVHYDVERQVLAILGFLLPLGFVAVLILYHRLLASARQAVLNEAAERVGG